MLVKIMYIIFLMILVVSSVSLSKILMRKFKLNRWIIAFLAPLVLIVPSIIFKDLNNAVWTVLIVIFFVMCILFFELNREADKVKWGKNLVKYRRKK